MLELHRTVINGLPRTSAADAKEIARRHWNLDGSATPLAGERDATFLVRADSGQRIILKIVNAADGPLLAELQQRALVHAGRSLTTVPSLVPAANGEWRATIPASDGQEQLTAWAMTCIDGTPLARIPLWHDSLLHGIGEAAAAMTLALDGFEHPMLQRKFHWDVASGCDVVRRYRTLVTHPTVRAAIDGVLARTEPIIDVVRETLPVGAVHGDLNEHNIFVAPAESGAPADLRVAGIIDFGDVIESYLVAELAVALAYAMQNTADPLGAAVHVTRGYNAVRPLDEQELRALFPLAALRVCMSITIGAFQRGERPNDAYLGISDLPMRRLLDKIARIPFELAEGALRECCGHDPSPRSSRITRWLGANTGTMAPVLRHDLRTHPALVLDLSVGSPLVSGDAARNGEPYLTERVRPLMKEAGVEISVGRYNEPRLLYTAPFFALDSNPFQQRRAIHIGLDLFGEAGTEVFAPMDATVHAFANNATEQDYGPVIILRHETGDGDEFFTLYGHLSRSSLDGLYPGKVIHRGERFAWFGTPEENVGWSPHLHLQVITDLMGCGTDFAGVGDAGRRDIWCAFCPDPNLIVGIPSHLFPAAGTGPHVDEILERRRAHLGGNLSVAYSSPVAVTRGWMQYLYDESGRKYLDAYNNVPHVGHSHPRVVEAVAHQLSVLNTNTRYPQRVVAGYAERLCELFPAELSVCYLVNSGSEANELAIRLARAHTRGEHVVVLEHGYHGNTNAAIDLSHYKHARAGGRGAPSWVHSVPQPDVYRGRFRAPGDDESGVVVAVAGGGPDSDAGSTNSASADARALVAGGAGGRYADLVGDAITRVREQGGQLAAFIAETCPSVGGQIIPPLDYFAAVYSHVRGAGGVCIADEVQTGFGRMGRTLWAFEEYGVVPDIVALGKPAGNGYPVGAVITTRAIADSFENGMEFFSTFGGSTVSCAAGTAVLNVLAEESLQQRALATGTTLGAALNEIRGRHHLIGDVRGSGLFWGVELVRDRETRQPATREATWVVETLRDQGILCGTDGPDHNVVKIRPPMQFTEGDAAMLAEQMDRILGVLGR